MDMCVCSSDARGRLSGEASNVKWLRRNGRGEGFASGCSRRAAPACLKSAHSRTIQNAAARIEARGASPLMRERRGNGVYDAPPDGAVASGKWLPPRPFYAERG